jgi:hypothetical protein
LAMTRSDYFWLAKVLAVMTYKFVGIGAQEDMYIYFVERLVHKYSNFDPKLFRAEYEKQYEMLGPRVTG